MASGTIKFFNANKGFGFVTPDGGSADLFLPAATLAASGLSSIQPGQRVEFDQAPDKKGPKVTKLQLIGEPVAKAPTVAARRVTVWCDPTSDDVADVLQVIRDAGCQLQLMDYTATPPSMDQLRQLSHLMSGSGRSLVRRHDPLFFALQLDDRFVGDAEFWTAIAEHPTLINGPVLTLSGQARVCKSADDVRAFLNNNGNVEPPKPKTLSPRVAALIRGDASVAKAPAEPERTAVATSVSTPAVEQPASTKQAPTKPASAVRRASTTAPKAKPTKQPAKPAKKLPSKPKAKAAKKKV